MISEENLEKFRTKAIDYLKYLSQYEKASKNAKTIYEADLSTDKNSTRTMRAILKDCKTNSFTTVNETWNYWFEKVKNKSFNNKEAENSEQSKINSFAPLKMNLNLEQLGKKNTNNKREEENENFESKKKVLVYPNKDSHVVLDVEDFDQNELIVILYQENSNKKVYIWKSNEDFDEDVLNEFVNSCQEGFWDDTTDAELIYETPYDESEEFLSLI
jgi:hypothetical protein